MSEAWIRTDQPHQFDSIHARHINISDQHVKSSGADLIPGIHSVDSDCYVVAQAGQQLPLNFAHGDGIFSDQDAFGNAARARSSLGSAHTDEGSFTELLTQCSQGVFNVNNERGRAIVKNGSGGDVRDLAKSRVQGSDHQVLFAEEFGHYQTNAALIVAQDHHAGGFIARRFSQSKESGPVQ